MTDASKVRVGLADYVTGAITHGPLVKTIPTDIDACGKATASFGKAGYVSNDGLQLSQDYSTNDVQDWNGSTVRKLLESFTGEIAFTLMQAFSYEDACLAFGAENVERTAADAQHGERIHIHVGAHLAVPESYCFNMKDGDARMSILVPNGQVTAMDEIDFVANDAVKLPVTVSCYDDGTGTGDCIHIYTDDGSKASA